MLSFGQPEPNSDALAAVAIKNYEQAGITQLITAHELWGLSPEQHKRSIELFGKYVIPAFQTEAAAVTAAD